MMLVFILCLLCISFIWSIVLPFCVLVFRYTLGRRWYSKRSGLAKAGQWAIVTGSTDGIGKAFAEELASDGLNIMLISRTKEKLEKVSESLSSKYHVSVKCVVADFTKDDIYDTIKSEIDQLPSIACLVNNVGMYIIDYFPLGEESTPEHIRKMININDLSTAAMTHIVLPRLVKQNSGAALINVSSFAGMQALPYTSMYTATKAFAKLFSQSLALELKDKNVIIQALCPSYVDTELIAIRPRNVFLITPKMCAKSSLDMLGLGCVCCGHWLHAFLVFFYKKFIFQCCFNDTMEKKYEKSLKLK